MVFDSHEAARGNTECWGVRRQVLASCVDSPWHSDDAAASTSLGGGRCVGRENVGVGCESDRQV